MTKASALLIAKHHPIERMPEHELAVVRRFLFDGIRQEAKQLEYTSADPVTVGCRVIKSAFPYWRLHYRTNGGAQGRQ